MKSKIKGFTLVEMIVVIAIIAVFSVIVGFSANSLTKSAKETNNEAVIKEILNAGYLYCQLSSHKNECNSNEEFNVGIKSLIEAGLLDEKYNGKVVNPAKGNNEKFTDNDIVTVTTIDGERDVKYEYNNKEYKLSTIDGCSKSGECSWGE